MKKILILILLIAIIPAFAFADLQIGGIALYNGDTSTTTSLNMARLAVGAEARLKLWILQGGISALYVPNPKKPSIAALTDVGLALDILFLRFGAGIGPNFSFTPSGAIKLASAGLNLKLSGELIVGPFCVGLVGYYYLKDVNEFSKLGSKFQKLPWLGVTAMLKLF